MTTPLWLFGDQLGPHFHGGEHRRRPVLLVESSAALTRHRSHRQKLHLVLSGMRHLAAELGSRASLVRAETYREGLRRFGRPVVVHEPHSRAGAELVARLREEGWIEQVLPTPGFALSRNDFESWARDRKRFVMEDFYREQRRRFEVLLEPDGAPLGGRWNFDSENREGPPKRRATLGAPAPWFPAEDEIDERVRADLDSLDRRGRARPVGADGPRIFPVTAREARSAARRFLRHRLPEFGPHQDAMLGEDWAMAHALLSVPLNLGLLDPLRLVRDAEREHRRGSAPLASTEGFVRQVLGWREYVWQLYWHLGPGYQRRNALRARTSLPRWWRELDAEGVSAECLRVALAGVRDRGWAHHIQRLMVLGNHALQRGYQPAQLNDWFATAFVDGTPWVMPANVIGMSQYADGGLVATKPYAAGGAYLNRMSDHCRSCPYDPKQRTGEAACPFTAGYWAWMHRNADALVDNHRMKQPLSTMRRLDDLEELVHQERRRREF
ncbi:cryptochrome/photolyase family protein [Saccharopolyspora sp. MS10]|uniref:cryptochrome/photolyase family protein n=1 Tax=Saccharopolyspora sp. MS10 TaxID=3385973 RepID=UPI0039A2E116